MPVADPVPGDVMLAIRNLTVSAADAFDPRDRVAANKLVTHDRMLTRPALDDDRRSEHRG
jgi:hypothetical protein